MRSAAVHRALAIAASASFVLACSGGTEREAERGRNAFSPTGLNVSAHLGTNSVFNVVALTLRPGSSGAELYAAVRNEGDIAACNPSFSVELRDRGERVIAAGISGLSIKHFYRLRDGSETVAGCVPPGELSMVAITDLSLDGALDDVNQVVYASSYWVLDAVAIDGIGLSEVEVVPRGSGVAYAGVMLNRLEITLAHPTVAFFPVNSAGRPLGVAYAGSTSELPPGGTWKFETNPSSEAGVGYEAYPMGGP